MCPYPGCNRVVRRIHHHLTAGKHKLSRKDSRYLHYLKSATSFVDETKTVSFFSETSDLGSSENYTDERARIEMEDDEKKTEDWSLSSRSSEEEE